MNLLPTRPAPEYRVFVSHGGADTYIVRELLRPKLLASGARVFLDDGAIAYGDDFRIRVLDELKSCHEVVVLLTPSAMARPWVFAEVGATIIQDKRLVAVSYGGTDQYERLGIGSLGRRHGNRAFGPFVPKGMGRAADCRASGT
jgi:hypothetical protein